MNVKIAKREKCVNVIVKYYRNRKVFISEFKGRIPTFHISSFTTPKACHKNNRRWRYGGVDDATEPTVGVPLMHSPGCDAALAGG